MKRMLRKQKAELYYYERDIKKMGAHANVTGNISRLTGNISRLTGDISAGLTGDISGLTGNISGKIEGDIDLCEITDGERRKGIDIEDLILAD